MATETIQVKVELIDEISNEVKAIRSQIESNFDKIRQEGKKTENGFDSLKKSALTLAAGLVSIAAARKIIGFLGECAEEANQAALAQAKLSQALGYTSEALNEQSAALQKTTLYEDDQVTAAQALLANYVKQEDQIKKLIPAVLDFATATGQDLTSAAQMVARAIADDGAEMGRYKIAVQGAAGSMERINSLSNGLINAYGGQAKAAAEASNGIAQATNTYKDFQEEIGQVITPAIKYMTGALNDLTDAATAFFHHWNKSKKEQLSEQIVTMEKDIESVTSGKSIGDKIARWGASLAGLNVYIDERKKAIASLKDELAKLDAETEVQKSKASKANITGKPTTYTMPTIAGGVGIYDEVVNAAETAATKYVDAWSQTKPAIEAQRKFESEIMSDRVSDMEYLKDKNKEFLDAQIIDTNQYVDNLSKIMKKEQAIRSKVWQSSWDMGTSLMQLGKQAVASSRADAIEKRTILTGLAIAEAAAAAVKGIFQIWTDNATGSVWGNVAASVAIGAEIIAAAWTQISSINSQQFARGTMFAPGGMALVGEEGPELVNLPRGSQVYTAGQTQSMMSGSGGINLTLNVPDGAYITDSAANTISQSMESLGRMLFKADRAGYLQDWKSQLRMAT